MVKLKGPVHALEASGTIADILTITASARGHYAKRKSIPAQPRTGKQISVRAVMKWLAQEWKLLTPAEQATWQPMADARRVAAYHCFVAENHQRWTEWLAPSKEYPATETGTVSWPSSIIGSGGPGIATVGITPGLPQPTWGYALLRADTPVGWPKRSAVVALIPVNLGGITWYRDTPLAPGTYYYHSRGFNVTGLWGTQWGNKPITVT